MNDIQLTDRGLVLKCPHCGQRNRLKFERLRESFRCGKCQFKLDAANEPIDVHDEEAFSAALELSVVPILVDFWAPWCGPCKMVAPEVMKLASDVAGEVLVLKINTEDLPGLAEQFDITGLPTFMLFDHGQPVAKQSGAMSAAHLKRFIGVAV